jgi:arylsulfatase A
LGKSKTNIYGDFVLQCDWTVGQVLEALRQNNIEENTIVIFTSDNGCSPRAHFDELGKFDHDPSYVFRGHKADIYEGGHRIPFLVRWPGQTNAHVENKKTICLTDLMATCADLVGSDLPDNAGEDSVSFLPLLLDERVKNRSREAIVHHSVNGEFSIRKGKWKLEMCAGSGGWSYPRPGKDDTKKLPPIQLYDLENDIGETQNVYDKNPTVVKELTDLLTEYVKRGRSTTGKNQKNDPPEDWKQQRWMKEK